MRVVWKRVPSSRAPAVQTQPRLHQSRSPQLWSRWPIPSKSIRSSPTRISPCTWQGISYRLEPIQGYTEPSVSHSRSQPNGIDRKSVVEGTRVTVRVDLG